MPSDADWVSEYGPPVDQLLTVGETPARKLKWPDYLTYGFTREDLPELMRMVADPRFDMLDSENVAVWAPLHAWRVLGQLRAEEAIETLISLFSRADDDDWVQSDLPKAIALIGPPAVPALAEYLLQGERGIWARVAAAATLVEIAGAFPGAREACVSALIEALKGYETNSPLFNGCLISDLTIDLHALEALPAIREAFARHCVDTSIMGGLREVELELGVRAPPPSVLDLAGLRGSGPAVELSPTGIPWSHVGRNDLCPCGSGFKFKKCCLKRVEAGKLR